MEHKKQYLGDGLYIQDHGFQIELTAPRMDGEHFVCLDDHTLDAFFKFIERSRGLEIKISKAKGAQNDR